MPLEPAGAAEAAGAAVGVDHEAVEGGGPPGGPGLDPARVVLGGEHAVVLMTEVRGAANAKARRELGWQPAHRSWREGFRTALAAA